MKSSPQFSPAARRAFTLIEIMVSIAIFTMIVAAVYASWAALMRSTRVAHAAADRAQRERVTLRTIEDSLMSVQSFQASPQYYSFIVQNGGKPMLSFAARLPEVFPRNGKFFDPVTGKNFNLRRVTYTLESVGKENDLVLRQNPVLMDVDADEQKYPLVLAKNVHKFSIDCWDTNKLEWIDEWDDTNAIPPLVRVNLTLATGTGDDASSSSSPDFSIVRVFSLPSETLPAALQNGAAAPRGQPQVPQPPPQQPR